MSDTNDTPRFTVTVECPDCGRTHSGASASIPQFCECGFQIWKPIKPKGRTRDA